MAVDRNKLDELLKQLAGELQDDARQSAESLLQANYGGSTEKGAPSVRSFFGVWDSGYPHSADNDRIEADLVRA